MKRLHRLVIVSFIGPFVMTFFIVLFILLMQFLWRYIDELVGKGLDFSIIGELLLYASAGLVPLALPLAILLSSLMTFGNMGEYYELTAIKASGISLRRIMMPLFILVTLISIGAFFFSNNVLPVTNLKMRSLRWDVQRLRPEVSITEGVFYKGLDNYVIRVNKKDLVKNLLYGIKIYNHSGNKGNLDVTIADSGRMKMTADRRNMILTLWSGYKYTEIDEGRRKKNKSYPHEMLKFREQRIIIEMTGFEFSRSDENIHKSSYQMLNVTQLKRFSDSLKIELFKKSREFSRNLVKSSFFKINNDPGVRNIARELRLNNSSTGVSYVYDDVTALQKEPAGKAAARRAAKQQRADLKPAIIATVDSPVRNDSDLIVRKTLRIGSFDSLFSSFSLNDRQEFISAASNSVSQNQYLVVSVTQSMDNERRLLRRHEIEWHRKFTLSFACLIFLFIGAPLGAIIRKGGLGLPAVISTLLFILYYIISLTGQKFVEESILSSFQGMWLSSVILFIAGVFLTYQATNDSAILNIDTYLNWVREKAGLRKGVLLEKKAHVAGRFDLIDIPRNKLQSEFKSVHDMASGCLESLKNDSGWHNLLKISFGNSGLFYLIEFGIHYNSFIDQTILSNWFRIPYFQKRLAEFPLINGRITSDFFTKKTTRWISAIVFPVGMLRLIHLKMKVTRIRRNLHQIMELSTGMVNLLSSSAFKPDTENL